MDEADIKLLKEYEQGIVELYEQQGIFGTQAKIVPSISVPIVKKSM